MKVLISCQHQGEVRGDWHENWVVIVFPPSSSPLAHVGIEVLTNRLDELHDETLREAQVALDNLDRHYPELNGLKICWVTRDKYCSLVSPFSRLGIHCMSEYT